MLHFIYLELRTKKTRKMHTVPLIVDIRYIIWRNELLPDPGPPTIPTFSFARMQKNNLDEKSLSIDELRKKSEKVHTI